MGVIPALRLSFYEGKDWSWLQNWSSNSWALTPVMGQAARFVSMVLYGVPFIGFIGAALDDELGGAPRALETLGFGLSSGIDAGYLPLLERIDTRVPP